MYTQLSLEETFQMVPVESSRMFRNSDSLISEIPQASETRDTQTDVVITEGRHTIVWAALKTIILPLKLFIPLVSCNPEYPFTLCYVPPLMLSACQLLLTGLLCKTI